MHGFLCHSFRPHPGNFSLRILDGDRLLMAEYADEVQAYLDGVRGFRILRDDPHADASEQEADMRALVASSVASIHLSEQLCEEALADGQPRFADQSFGCFIPGKIKVACGVARAYWAVVDKAA